MTDANSTPEAEPTPAGGDAAAARIAELETKLSDTNDALLRALAEIENVRRRGERQQQEARAFAIEKFAKDLLPVADALERALAAIPEDERGRIGEGVAMTHRALDEVFARHGLRRVGAAGEPFDPNLHQAMARIPSEVAAGAVAEVMQPGYVLNDRTVRAAIVAISLGPSSGIEGPSPFGDLPAEAAAGAQAFGPGAFKGEPDPRAHPPGDDGRGSDDDDPPHRVDVTA